MPYQEDPMPEHPIHTVVRYSYTEATRDRIVHLLEAVMVGGDVGFAHEAGELWTAIQREDGFDVG